MADNSENAATPMEADAPQEQAVPAQVDQVEADPRVLMMLLSKEHHPEIAHNIAEECLAKITPEIAKAVGESRGPYVVPASDIQGIVARAFKAAQRTVPGTQLWLDASSASISRGSSWRQVCKP